MSTASERLAAAGLHLLGTKYRLHGRDPQFGLDCVGVILAAFAACGHHSPPVLSYGIRNRTTGFFPELARSIGLCEIGNLAQPVRAGDILVTRPGPAQWHLLLATSATHAVHAHAGLRKVVLAAHPLPQPPCQIWRLAHDQ